MHPLHSRLSAIRFDGALRFINVSSFEKAVLRLEQDNPKIETILIKCSGIHEIDASGVDMLSKLVTRFRSNGISLCFSGFTEQALDVIDRTGLKDTIGSHNLFSTDQTAIETLQNRLLDSAGGSGKR